MAQVLKASALAPASSAAVSGPGVVSASTAGQQPPLSSQGGFSSASGQSPLFPNTPAQSEALLQPVLEPRGIPSGASIMGQGRSPLDAVPSDWHTQQQSVSATSRQEEAEEASGISVAAKLQGLNLDQEKPVVIIPEHMLTEINQSSLSFGSFGEFGGSLAQGKDRESSQEVPSSAVADSSKDLRSDAPHKSILATFDPVNAVSLNSCLFAFLQFPLCPHNCTLST